MLGKVFRIGNVEIPESVLDMLADISPPYCTFFHENGEAGWRLDPYQIQDAIKHGELLQTYTNEGHCLVDGVLFHNGVVVGSLHS